MYDFTGGGSTPGPTSEVGDVVLATEAPSADWLPLDGSHKLRADYPTAIASSSLFTPIENPGADVYLPDHTVLLANPAGFTKEKQSIVANKEGTMVLYFAESTNYRYSVDGGVTWQNSTVSFPKPMVSGMPYIDGTNYILLCDNERGFYRFDPSDFSSTALFENYDPTVTSTPNRLYEWIRPDAFVYVNKDDASTVHIYKLGEFSPSQFSLAPFTTVGSAIGMYEFNGDIYYATNGSGATILGNLFRISLYVAFSQYRLQFTDITNRVPNTNTRTPPSSIIGNAESVQVSYVTAQMNNKTIDGETFTSTLSYASSPANYMRLKGTTFAYAEGGDGTGPALSFVMDPTGEPTFVDNSNLESNYTSTAAVYCKLTNTVLHTYYATASYGVSKVTLISPYSNDKFKVRYIKSPTYGLSYFVKGK